MASFTLPHLQETSEIWGPPSTVATASTASTASSTQTTSTRVKSSQSVLPHEFRDIPFTPFAKSDKIGRFADWNAVSASLPHGDGAGRGNAGAGNAGGDDQPRGVGANGLPIRGAAAGLRGGAGGQQGGRRNDGLQTTLGVGASTFAYFHGSDEASFSIVDNARTGAKRGGGLSQMTRGRGGAQRGGRGGALGGAAMQGGRGGAMGGRGGRGMPQRGGASFAGGMGGRGGGGGRRGGWRDWDRPQRTRDPSVIVGPDWETVEEIEFSRLSKLRLDVTDAKEISSFGTLYEYDRSYDRINSVRFEKPLQLIERVRYNPTSSEDPILQQIASEPATASGDDPTRKPPTRILVTDSILAMLMCTTRSVNPWDIVITRDGKGNIFMDKRDGGAFDFVTVNENAADPPADPEVKEGETAKPQQSINAPGNLSLEATYINQNFAFQVVNEKKKHSLPDGPNPFYDANAEKEQLASCGYRYRKFDLSTPDHDVELVVRTELDAILVPAQKGQPNQYITIKTLNEFDSRAQGAGGAPDWRTKLDSQRGAVVATEMKNNGAKLARFAVQSVLANADNMKMGYISRVSARDSSRHVILGTQWYKPRDFAAQINVNFSNGWGIVRTVADLVSKPAAKPAANAEDGVQEASDAAAKSLVASTGPAKFVLAKDPNKPLLRLYRVPLSWPADEENELDDGVLIDSVDVPAATET